jgi:hypothetical protein
VPRGGGGSRLSATASAAARRRPPQHHRPATPTPPSSPPHDMLTCPPSPPAPPAALRCRSAPPPPINPLPPGPHEAPSPPSPAGGCKDPPPPSHARLPLAPQPHSNTTPAPAPALARSPGARAPRGVWVLAKRAADSNLACRWRTGMADSDSGDAPSESGAGWPGLGLPPAGPASSRSHTVDSLVRRQSGADCVRANLRMRRIHTLALAYSRALARSSTQSALAAAGLPALAASRYSPAGSCPRGCERASGAQGVPGQCRQPGRGRAAGTRSREAGPAPLPGAPGKDFLNKTRLVAASGDAPAVSPREAGPASPAPTVVPVLRALGRACAIGPGSLAAGALSVRRRGHGREHRGSACGACRGGAAAAAPWSERVYGVGVPKQPRGWLITSPDSDTCSSCRPQRRGRGRPRRCAQPLPGTRGEPRLPHRSSELLFICRRPVGAANLSD